MPFLPDPTHWCCVEGFRLHGLRAGAGDPVLLVHGAGTWLYSFHALAPLLAASWAVLALDVPGHGYTVADTTFPVYDLETTTRVIGEFLDRHEFDRVHLVGAGWGGGWCTAFALRRPDRVRTLALVTPSGLAGIEERRYRRLRHPLIGELCVHTLTRIQVRSYYRRCFHDPGRVAEEMVAAVWQPLRWPENRWPQYHYVRRSDWDPVNRALGSLKPPVRVIWGAEDRCLSPNHVQRLTQIPGMQVEVLPRCGHLPHEESPGAVAQILERFWTGG